MRHIANLGHGVYPDIDPDKVRLFVNTIKSLQVTDRLLIPANAHCRTGLQAADVKTRLFVPNQMVMAHLKQEVSVRALVSFRPEFSDPSRKSLRVLLPHHGHQSPAI
jgi:hypothetical protein